MKRDEKIDQIGKCDICQQHTFVRRIAAASVLCRAHDHGNDKWRGLLCSKCNIGSGWTRRGHFSPALYVLPPPSPVSRGVPVWW
jgi:Recombination endonuclease VII